MGPRSCAVCPGPREGCTRCGAKDQHRHLALLDRHGDVLGSLPLCESCAARLTVGGIAGTTKLTDALSVPEVTA